MSTWKDPNRLVWHTARCSRCNRIISRAKLPGLMRQTVYRPCANVRRNAGSLLGWSGSQGTRPPAPTPGRWLGGARPQGRAQASE